jgi:retron-type reverse transcriptase
LSLARDNYGDGGDGQSVGWSFGSIDQTKLLKLVALRISDRRVLKLLRLWLAAGVMEGEQWVATLSGTPQGGVISPLLSNIYLHVLDRVWEDRCAPWDAVNPQGEEPMPEAKPYAIPKQLVWDAYQRVKANRGAAGVDGESLAAFETDLKNNLYKVWNRMASGSYFPPPVRLVEIEKESGGTRPLGIPTVADRVAQTVVKMVLEPIVDPHFHSDSYGYRPGKSALDAVGVARKRAGTPTGSSTWISKAFSIPFRTTWSSALWRITPIAHGSDCTLRGGFVRRCSVQTARGRSGRGHAARWSHQSAAG